jgi:hypothetical protein
VLAAFIAALTARSTSRSPPAAIASLWTRRELQGLRNATNDPTADGKSPTFARSAVPARSRELSDAKLGRDGRELPLALLDVEWLRRRYAGQSCFGAA